MDGASIEKTLGRIEAALARIEKAATRGPSASTDSQAADLQARHDRLRGAVAQSLRQLDELIKDSGR